MIVIFKCFRLLPVVYIYIHSLKKTRIILNEDVLDSGSGNQLSGLLFERSKSKFIGKNMLEKLLIAFIFFYGLLRTLNHLVARERNTKIIPTLTESSLGLGNFRGV